MSHLISVQVDGSVANHPNLWYQTSVRYHKAKSNTIEAGEEKGFDEEKEMKMEVVNNEEVNNEN